MSSKATEMLNLYTKLKKPSKEGYTTCAEGSTLYGYYDKTGLTFPFPIQDEGRIGTDSVLYDAFETTVLESVRQIGKKNIKNFVHVFFKEINSQSKLSDHRLHEIGIKHGFNHYIITNMVLVSFIYYLTATKQIPDNNDYGVQFVNYDKYDQPRKKFNAVIRKIMEYPEEAPLQEV